MRCIFLVAVLFGWSAACNAQQLICPGGLPYGHPLCVPMPQRVQTLEPLPDAPKGPVTATWPRFGAIVLDPVSGDVRTAEDKPLPNDAAPKALAACREGRPINHCKVLLTYENQCAALAWPDLTKGAPATAGVGMTEQAASELALKKCQVKGGACEIVYSGCSLPVIRTYP